MVDRGIRNKRDVERYRGGGRWLVGWLVLYTACQLLLGYLMPKSVKQS